LTGNGLFTEEKEIGADPAAQQQENQQPPKHFLGRVRFRFMSRFSV
jgi:hypothetical protein